MKAEVDTWIAWYAPEGQVLTEEAALIAGLPVPPTATAAPTGTFTATPSATHTSTPTPTRTMTQTATATPTVIPTATARPTICVSEYDLCIVDMP